MYSLKIKNTNKANLIAIIFLVFLTSCGPRWTKERERTLRQNGGKVKVGMPRKEVKELLGKPDFYAPRLDPTRLLYLDKDMEKAKEWEYVDPEDNDFTKSLYFDLKTEKVKKITRENSEL
jgi:outer membrane protein assembly factor BamE (lipoprotein component of BamABCDE complex)